MKKFFVCVILLLCVGMSALAAPLDEIQNYIIHIIPEENGSLMMQFTLNWKVLDSETEGPLSWVRIGIPNRYADEIYPMTDRISNIRYDGENGDFVRIDLDREYEAGEIVPIMFSIHQSYMCSMDEDSYIYDYTPGWFDEIEVKNIRVYWAEENVAYADAPEQSEGWYLWQDSLAPGERMHIEVRYDKSVFVENVETVDDMKKQERITAIIITTIIMIALAMIIIILVRSERRGTLTDEYESYRGFAGAENQVMIGDEDKIPAGVDENGVVFSTVYGAGYHHGHGGGYHCACACACACAGGGRAGCSRKDFYNTKLESKEIVDILREKRAE